MVRFTFLVVYSVICLYLDVPVLLQSVLERSSSWRPSRNSGGPGRGDVHSILVLCCVAGTPDPSVCVIPRLLRHVIALEWYACQVRLEIACRLDALCVALRDQWPLVTGNVLPALVKDADQDVQCEVSVRHAPATVADEDDHDYDAPFFKDGLCPC